ncbi:hypothetical protein [Streptomyces sp. NBC_00691]|uniref:hypothetical protein n=1 Tax=Streptomyces sp. NBC_00691 TaxID=2903671 RepID=UPI002E3508BB|nr:hypothetical protein [Streptomyces sp. NBC_00691]
MRETYDESGAAGRLRVPVAAWRWAAASGLVPAADAGPRLWSRAVVEAADAEAVRAALRGPVGASWAADRLTEALGEPRRFRPRVTASAVGYLVRAGLLTYLGGEPAFPDVHPDQVAALARRRDLPALLDRHVPLGPDQAAHRLGVRRTDFDQVVRLGWITPTATVDIDYKRHGGWTTVPLFSGEDVALLPLTRLSVDWHALRTLAPGRRSPLAALTPDPHTEARVFLAGVARIAHVGRAAVVNWRRRHPDFPAPAGGSETHPEFALGDVVAWLLAHDKIAVPSSVPAATLTVRPSLGAGAAERLRMDDPLLELTDDPTGEDRLSGWMTDTDADTLAQLATADTGAALARLTAPGTTPLAVPDGLAVIDRFRAGTGGLRVTLAWPARLRGTASPRHTGGVIRHGLPHTPATQCQCVRHACGAITPTPYCADHGRAVEPVMEWHPADGIRCAALRRPR